MSFPRGTFSKFERVLQPTLFYLGIDVSNTPLTPDMMLMFDDRYSESMYKHPLVVSYKNIDKKVFTVSWEDLPFYKFRIPGILFIEMYYWGLPVRAEIHALCLHLVKKFGEVESFMFTSDLPDEISRASGMNRWFSCQ
jgi:hypothetical protein